jgi:membrane-bound metal-dependent hydrolase YbcI (DUF457 family)
MAQAGIHALVGQAVRKWGPRTEWLMLGLVLGNIFPDFDNIAVAVATVAKLPTEGLHRTFTHSLFTVLVLGALFWGIGRIKNESRWGNFGLGFGIGILMHILLDLLIWFNGVEILWPIPSWINLWQGIRPPGWFDTLMNPVEFLVIALFFWTLERLAHKHQTDVEFLGKLRVWIMVFGVLFVIFTPLAYMMQKGFMTVFGAVYLVMLGVATGLILRMRKTIEAG